MTCSGIKALLGTWITDPSDILALELYDRVAMRFDADGPLMYAMVDDDSNRGAFLTYRVEGDCQHRCRGGSPVLLVTPK